MDRFMPKPKTFRKITKEETLEWDIIQVFASIIKKIGSIFLFFLLVSTSVCIAEDNKDIDAYNADGSPKVIYRDFMKDCSGIRAIQKYIYDTL